MKAFAQLWPKFRKKKVSVIFITAGRFLKLKFAVLDANTVFIILRIVTLPFHMAQLVQIDQFELPTKDADNLLQRKARKNKRRDSSIPGGVGSHL